MSERAWWLERDRVQRNRHSCGHDRDVCSDPEREWFAQLTVCYPTQEQAAYQWRYSQLREKHGEYHDGTRKSWSKKRSASHPYHYMDGTTIWASDVDHGHGGDFLRTEDRPEPDDTDHN